MFARALRLAQCFLCWWTPPYDDDVSVARIIVTQACSNLVGGTSNTNHAIARRAADLAERLEIPIWAQGEVAQALKVLGFDCVGSTPVQSVANPLDEKYLDTRGVAEQTAKYCKENSIIFVLLVQYSPHAWRVKWCLEKLRLVVLIPRGLPSIQFEPGFEQQRLARWWTFYPFELAARLVYWWKGYI